MRECWGNEALHSEFTLEMGFDMLTLVLSFMYKHDFFTFTKGI